MVTINNCILEALAKTIAKAVNEGNIGEAIEILKSLVLETEKHPQKKVSLKSAPRIIYIR